MCGLICWWQLDGSPIALPALRRAVAVLRHRGPDDVGYCLIDTRAATARPYGGAETPAELQLPPLLSNGLEPFADLALGFRRLSILDLSAAGHQPMSTADGALWLVFNGEIYNYVELRAELQEQGHVFHSHTDTEVILAAYAQWGEACLGRFNGMWAFALWDGRRRCLLCARDRFGIKPLYYVHDRGRFACASEIKALLALPGTPRRPNSGRIYDYLSVGLVDHDAETFFADLAQLPPAHYLTVEGGVARLVRYWHLAPECRLTESAAWALRFRELFEDAVRLHLRSDVAVGTCLSGGLDSSAIVCVANKLMLADGVVPRELVGERQKIFSACFDDRRFDERPYIEQVLQATGAEPNYVFPTVEQLLVDLPQLIWHQEEPFESTSIYAQWCVMRQVAQRGVRVLLDGQGGDELLAGYHDYFDYFWGMLLTQGRWRQLAGELVAYRRRYGASPLSLMPRVWRVHLPEPLQRLGRRWGMRRRSSALAWSALAPDLVRAFAHRRGYNMSEGGGGDPFWAYLARTLTNNRLPSLLRYEDRNSMAHSIEARVPFLDYRLVEFVFALPAEQKIDQAWTKVILRQALAGILPETIRARADKVGFVTPERIWLGQALGELGRVLAESPEFRAHGYCRPERVTAALQAHAAGRVDLTSVGWRWINLELWLRQFIDADPLAGLIAG